jgi:hypothetical protein
VVRSAEPSLLQSLASDIQAHNSKCPENPVDGRLTQQIQKESTAAQEKAAKEKAQQERNAADFPLPALGDKAKLEAFVAWKQRIVAEPFAFPAETWVPRYRHSFISSFRAEVSRPAATSH